MKELLTRWAVIPGLVFAMISGFTSCKDPQTQQAKFTITQEKVDVPAEGGSFFADYTVENPSQGTEAIPSCEADWISNFTTSDSQIHFDVAANEQETTREATVTVTYGDLEDSFTVVQAAAGTVAFEVAINIDSESITESTVTFDAIPNDPEQTYMMTGVVKSEYDKCSSDEEFIQDDIQYWTEQASGYGMTLEDYLREVLPKGELKNQEMQGLSPEKEYALYAYGLDYDGTVKSGLFIEFFTTKAVEMIDMTFDISYEINIGDVKMTIKPSEAGQRYYYDVFSKADLEGSGMSIKENVEYTIQLNISFGSIFGMSIEDILAQLLVSGEQAFDLTLKAQTDYVGFAVAVNDNGNLCSEITEKEFRTGDVEPSDNVITLSVTGIGVDKATAEVTTTNNDEYALLITYAKNFTGMSDAEILEAATTKYDLEENVFTGNQSLPIEGLAPETDYIALAFGYSYGVATTGLSKQEFSTDPAGDPSNMTFEFTVDNVGSKTADVTVTGTPETAGFYFDLAPAGTTGEQIKGEFEADIQSMLDMGWISSAAEYWQGMLSRGTGNRSYTTLMSNTEYTPFAFGVNETTGEIASEVQFGETFRTKEAQQSTSTIKIGHDKYFDADELADKYPGEYDDFAGQGLYCMPMKVETTGDVKTTYFTVFSQDLLDETEFTDELLINNLVDQGKGSTRSEVHYFLPYDTDLTIVAVAEDNAGNYSKVYRELVNCSKSGTSPVDEFVPIQAPARMPAFQQQLPFKAIRLEGYTPKRTSAPLVTIGLAEMKEAGESISSRQFDFSKKQTQSARPAAKRILAVPMDK